MGVPYASQVAQKDAAARALVGERVALEWLPPVTGPESGFRTKAKMVIGGTVDAPTLGILDAHLAGVDLRDCGVLSPGLRAAMDPIARLITAARIPPYDVATKRGEAKHAILTESPDGALMLRLVLRSTEAIPRLRKHLPDLLAALPQLHVVTANLLPAHAAVLEGETELVLTDDDALAYRIADVVLHLGPRAFVQTNTIIASALYREAREWVDEVAPVSVWDLYCGIGGFAFAVAGEERRVLGVELSPDAIAAARRSARDAGLADRVEFFAGDATAAALGAASAPDLVIVNPPRRGIGPELAQWLEASGVGAVLYSSCNPESLAADLERMPSLTAVRARLFDMFPQTRHAEVLVLLERR
jgi:23S rRNA (uracil747-C5)-methyltransferase